MAAATNAMMMSIQAYVRTAVAAETANAQPTADQPGQLATLQSRLETANQENSDLRDRIKQTESKKSTRHIRKRTFISAPMSTANTDIEQAGERDTVKAAFSSYLGFPLPDSKHSRHSQSKGSKFPQFKNFPVEIRMKIWKLALPAGRVFDLSNVDAHFSRVLRAPIANNNGAPNPALVLRQASGLTEMSLTAHKTPKLRLACKEANKAFLEAGGFEFGLFGGAYKGLWFNYSEDILYVREEPRSWTNLDMSRIIRVAFPHNRFMCKADATAKMDLILDHFTSCKEVILMQTMEWDIRSCLASPRLPAKLFPLRDNDPISTHEYPKELSDDIGCVAAWGDVKRIVGHIWEDHVVSVKHLSAGRIPKFSGIEVLRARPSYFD
ncbi:hypothetical protein CORC01_05675 [Colletotrichum orchidophilum]|uniref:2EXR domain-containing protein n=1 Tax=Colletotrichum orchidophilum TaxID=1209926 RepID=A0A1G4BCA8_9PEZI|nr:uncharacterized protein CORC01_05675 [Colletotrichum orchidophilum]OHE98985.1 hypothetical protein CORC01_05675 [Colletotrichum orchidophilum]